jgi:hypothetical protein
MKPYQTGRCLSDPASSASSDPWESVVRFILWTLLSLWIVAHGCHADRDTELRARPIAVERGPG